jgi:DNA repair exonuclease SbcCD ATPase subunit
MNRTELEQLIEQIVNKVIIEHQEQDKVDLNEVSYGVFKTENDDTPRKKVNRAISEINSKLLQIERLATHASRLKQEASVSSDHYWEQTKQKINRIQERITRLNQKMKHLGS